MTLQPFYSKAQNKISTSIIVSLLLLFVTQFTLAQTVHTVDNRPESGAQFTTVASAIAAAAPGDIIYIHPSPTSYGNFSIDKTLTIIGSGHDLSNFGDVRSTTGTITIGVPGLPDVSSTVITGLNIGSISAFSYGANSEDMHIINNRIFGTITGYVSGGTFSDTWIIEGNYFDSTASANNIDLRDSDNWNIRNNVFEGQIVNIDHTAVITNNLFINADTSGPSTIFVNVSGITSPIVTNNMFIFTDPDVTELINSGGTSVTYTNCLTWNSAEGGASDLIALPGSGNLDNSDPLFTNIPTSLYDFYNNDFTLQGGSPAEAPAGTDTTEIGIFGRNFPFDIQGRPHSMPYPELMVILNSVVQPGQNLNVQFQASQKN